jgi:tRNA (adenine22-N1)-methyltransferase
MVKNNRIDALVESIQGYHTVLDIGTDHGLVLKYAIDKKYIKKGIAADIAAMPLENAKNNLQGYPVSCVLSDGFKSIREAFDAVLIAGVGGMTIIDILSHRQEGDYDLILMPHDRLEKVRRYLLENNYGIISENIIFDKHYYTIFHVNKRKMVISEKEILTGFQVIMNQTSCAYFLSQYQKHDMLSKKATGNKKTYLETLTSYYKEVYHECLTKSSTI